MTLTVAAQRTPISDEEFDASVLRFVETLKAVRDITPGVGATFGLVPIVIAGATAKEAMKGLKDMTVDPNFVTPRDLLCSNSFTPPQRAR